MLIIPYSAKSTTFLKRWRWYTSTMNIAIKRFDKDFPLPAPTPRAAAFDFVCRETVVIPPGKIKAVAQNVAIQVPDGYVLYVFSRSSTPHKRGVMMANSVGVIDPFYDGDNDEILIFLMNITDEPVTISAGDRVAQGIIMKTEQVIWDETDHFEGNGHGGYNHKDNAKVFTKD